MTKLNSSFLESADYDLAAERLTIVLKNGVRYSYEGVRKEMADGLMRAESPGIYFQQVIKPQFTGVKDED